MRPSSAGREATRAMGTRLLKTWQRIRPTEVVGSALEARGRYTFPVAFGLVCAASDVTLVEAVGRTVIPGWPRRSLLRCA